MLNRFFILLVACFGVIGCSMENHNLIVDKFTLRSIKIEGNNSAMVRGDQQKRLFGAVTLEEHKQRLGQYYNLTWNLLEQPEAEAGDQPVRLIFHFQQASSGKNIKSITKTYLPGTIEGKWSFNNIGDHYAKGGRILAWRAELYYGELKIAIRESYLWSQ